MTELEKPTILFVDDEQEVLNALKRMTRKLDAECHFFQSARNALEFLNQHDADVVVSDYSMPEMNGYEFLSLVAQQYPESIRILLTAYKQQDIILEAINKGHVWGFINKPWDNDDLLMKLQQAIQTRQMIFTRVNTLFEQVKSARDEAKEANKAKDRFIATMTHELRTPLNGILGSLYLLKELTNNSEQRKFVDTAESAATGMLGLVNQILDYSKGKSSSQDVEISDWDIMEFLKQVHGLFVPKMIESGVPLLIEVGSDVPNVISNDAGKLQQILFNLIGNAVKYTATGDIRLSISHQDDALVFSVDDSGPGIPKEQQEDVFSPFVQLGDQSHLQGTGLGLTITAQIAQTLGGSIICQSSVQGGASFKVTLPYMPEQDYSTIDVPQFDNVQFASPMDSINQCWQRQLAEFNTPLSLEEYIAGGSSRLTVCRDHNAKTQMFPSKNELIAKCSFPLQQLLTPVHVVGKQITAEKSDTTPLTIMLVDDNMANQVVGRSMLQNLGHTAWVCANGQEAVESAKTMKFDLILMDLLMPILDGRGAIESIRATQNANQTTPILVLSANSANEQTDADLIQQIQGWLCKPFNKVELQESMNQALTSDGEATSKPIEPRAQEQALNIDTLQHLLDDTSVEAFPIILKSFKSEIVKLDGLMSTAPLDLPKIRLSAHSLKSSAGTIGAQRLAKIANDIETNASADNLDGVSNTLSDFKQESATILSELSHIRLEENTVVLEVE